MIFMKQPPGLVLRQVEAKFSRIPAPPGPSLDTHGLQETKINFYSCELGFKIKDGVPKLVLDYMSGKIMLDEFITQRMKLEQVNDVVKLMKNGECIRCILDMSK